MSQVPLRYCLMGLLLLAISACSEPSPRIVYITATPEMQSEVSIPESESSESGVVVTSTPFLVDNSAVANAPQASVPGLFPETYTVQAGDTLSIIAARFSTTVETLIELNEIENPDIISVGQVVDLPEPPSQQSPSLALLPDNRLVRGQSARAFDPVAFINSSTGYIRSVTDELDRRGATGFTFQEQMPASAVVAEVALQYSVDPRLLLALLEYRAGWLTRTDIPEELQDYPLVPKEAAEFDRKGLYRQLSWAANELNRGYYGWKYEGTLVLAFESGNRVLVNSNVNAATAAVHYLLHLENTAIEWLQDVSESGFIQTYKALFGDPFVEGAEPLIPVPLPQPSFTLPFNQGEIWYFTGGMHGGWGSGSAWAAIDFAPPDERTGSLCFISDYWVTAVSDGVITHSENGMIMLDIDGDGNETTGWVILYLHIASTDRVEVGTVVKTGDPIGKASCEGGFSTATHVHIARRYNGEWVPATCFSCGSNDILSNFNIGGWEVIGIPGAEYQGYLRTPNSERVAEQGRETPINQIQW